MGTPVWVIGENFFRVDSISRGPFSVRLGSMCMDSSNSDIPVRNSVRKMVKKKKLTREYHKKRTA